MTSKEAISTLQELGEFVRGASSTVEPPVAKKLKESPQAKAALAKKGEKEGSAKAETSKPAAKPSSTGAKPAGGAKPGASSAPKPGQSVPTPATAGQTAQPEQKTEEQAKPA